MISIVIPSYNQIEYLADAIDSALAQNVPVIVVDDGSTDGSLQLALKYQQEKGIKVVSQVNKGLASARNTGIMNATTEYVLFLDADDILLDNAVSNIQDICIRENPDIVAPSFKCFGLAGDEVILIKNPTLNDFIIEGKIVNRIGYCCAIKRDVLLEIGGYSPRMIHGYEDLHLNINLLSVGKKIVTTQEILWLYRIRNNSMISTSVKYHDELIAQIRKDFNV